MHGLRTYNKPIAILMEQGLLTLPEHQRGFFSMVFIVYFDQLHAFKFLVPCCDTRYNFRLKNYVRFVFTAMCLGLVENMYFYGICIY